METRQSKKLPVVYPFITSYAHHAHRLSIILNHPEDALPWVFNNFIQLEMPKYDETQNDVKLDFLVDNRRYTCPLIEDYFYPREIIETQWNSFTDFLIDNIEAGFYLATMLNERYVKGTLVYNERDHESFNMFFGYDRAKETIDFAGFLAPEGKYKYISASWEELNRSYGIVGTSGRPFHDMFRDVRAFKPVDQSLYNFEFQYSEMVRFFEEYLNSTNTHLRYEYPKDQYCKKIFFYGLDVYQGLIDHLFKLLERPNAIDHRPFYCLYDHKSLMLMRTEFLKKHRYLHNSELIYDRYVEIRDDCWNILMLFLKGTISKRVELLQPVVDLLNRTKDKEREVLELLMKNLHPIASH